MFEDFKSSLNTWNSTKNERQKLQHSYLVLAAIIVLVSGIISLFNAHAGHTIVKLALASLIIFVSNAIIWNLLKSSVIEKLSSRSRRR